MKNFIVPCFAFLLAACAVPPQYDDRPSVSYIHEDSRLTKPDHKSLQEALYDERREWQLCDGVDFGCIIEPASRYTLTVQLEGTILVGRHGIYSGLKRACGKELCYTSDALWVAQNAEGAIDEASDIASALYPQATSVWEREMQRLR